MSAGAELAWQLAGPFVKQAAIPFSPLHHTHTLRNRDILELSHFSDKNNDRTSNIDLNTEHTHTSLTSRQHLGPAAMVVIRERLYLQSLGRRPDGGRCGIGERLNGGCETSSYCKWNLDSKTVLEAMGKRTLVSFLQTCRGALSGDGF